MIKWTINYKNFNDEPRTQEAYFHLSEAELYEMEASIKGGLSGQLQALIDAQDLAELIALFKDIILRSYGVKSADGEEFQKSDELRTKFENTAAYQALFMELATSDEKGANFINGVVPANLRAPLDQDKPAGPPPLPAPTA